MFGGLGGDFYKDTYEAKLFGMHGGRFSVMWTSHGSHPFRRYIIPYLCFGSKMSNVYVHRVKKGRFSGVWRPLRGLL